MGVGSTVWATSGGTVGRGVGFRSGLGKGGGSKRASDCCLIVSVGGT